METSYKTTENGLENMLAFALVHDWGRDAFIANDRLLIPCDDRLLNFASMSDLKAWAGY